MSTSASSAIAPPAPGEAVAPAAPRQLDRIGVLDVLRGIALLGMFLVHFSDNSSTGRGLASLYQKIVESSRSAEDSPSAR